MEVSEADRSYKMDWDRSLWAVVGIFPSKDVVALVLTIGSLIFHVTPVIKMVII